MIRPIDRARNNSKWARPLVGAVGLVMLGGCGEPSTQASQAASIPISVGGVADVAVESDVTTGVLAPPPGATGATDSGGRNEGLAWFELAIDQSSLFEAFGGEVAMRVPVSGELIDVQIGPDGYLYVSSASDSLDGALPPTYNVDVFELASPTKPIANVTSVLSCADCALRVISDRGMNLPDGSTKPFVGDLMRAVNSPVVVTEEAGSDFCGGTGLAATVDFGSTKWSISVTCPLDDFQIQTIRGTVVGHGDGTITTSVGMQDGKSLLALMRPSGETQVFDLEGQAVHGAWIIGEVLSLVVRASEGFMVLQRNVG